MGVHDRVDADLSQGCRVRGGGQLVHRLKASGEWNHTLLIVASDHGSNNGLGVLDPLPNNFGVSGIYYTYRIPLIIVWPDRIAPAQRFAQPVSMIDMLPTILDLAALPMPDVMQGQSLAPLLLGEDGWEPRPVIIDEFYAEAETGELWGLMRAIDERWIANLFSINFQPQPGVEVSPSRQRRGRLRDRWADPYYGTSLHEKQPELMEKYTELLEAQLEENRALAERFTPGEESPLTPEQLRTLRALGYIQ